MELVLIYNYLKNTINKRETNKKLIDNNKKLF